MANWSELAGGFEPTGYGEHVGASGVRWDGPRRRLRRETAAAGASKRGLVRWDPTGLKGRLATVEQLTGDVWRGAAGSMKHWRRRNRSCTSADPRLKTTTWRTVQRLRAHR